MKEFESLGYEVNEDVFAGDIYISICKIFHKHYYTGEDMHKCILINTDMQRYLCHNILDTHKNCEITIQEHKLLNELFVALGWI